MPVLAESDVRSTHAQQRENMVITAPDPNNGRAITAETEVEYARVKYTDFDGNVKVQIFLDLRSAWEYADVIDRTWKAIRAANELGEDAKTMLYRGMLDELLVKIRRHGTEFFPSDINTAINEIEDYFDLTRTEFE